MGWVRYLSYSTACNHLIFDGNEGFLKRKLTIQGVLTMMSEKEIIDRTPTPSTVTSIVSDLGKMGLREGDTVLVHSSLSRIGWVAGGPQAVVQSLLQTVRSEGTLAMPAHSGDWS